MTTNQCGVAQAASGIDFCCSLLCSKREDVDNKLFQLFHIENLSSTADKVAHGQDSFDSSM